MAELKKFEIPYNFEDDYILELCRREKFFDEIEFVYMPCWKGHATNSRKEIMLYPWYPQTYEEYVQHIKKLQNVGVNICVLMQKNANLEMFEEYYDMGIRFFVMNDDILASNIKKSFRDVSISLSLTRIITEEEIKNDDLSMYDSIVLFFWYNRNIDVVESLPKKYKYVMLCNCECYWNCNLCREHWDIEEKTLRDYNAKQDKLTFICNAKRKSLRDRIYIMPEDLEYFDPFVYSYKIVDRLDPTAKIMASFDTYRIARERKPLHDRNFYIIDSK